MSRRGDSGGTLSECGKVRERCEICNGPGSCGSILGVNECVRMA
jgi:hypothetical protein